MKQKPLKLTDISRKTPTGNTLKLVHGEGPRLSQWQVVRDAKAALAAMKAARVAT
jgi:hypothetical protein